MERPWTSSWCVSTAHPISFKPWTSSPSTLLLVSLGYTFVEWRILWGRFDDPVSSTFGLCRRCGGVCWHGTSSACGGACDISSVGSLDIMGVELESPTALSLWAWLAGRGPHGEWLSMEWKCRHEAILWWGRCHNLFAGWCKCQWCLCSHTFFFQWWPIRLRAWYCGASQVVTILQSGDRGEDQRFDMLAPWHEPLMATLQSCIANPLVGWAAPCRAFRRWPWQHRRQVLALAWTDLLDPHTVPVLVVETVTGSELREWHIAYLPVQLRQDDVQFWAHRTGPCEIMDQWRHAHPTIPDRLTFAVGSQLWLRFPAAPRTEVTSSLHLLQVGVKRLRSSDDGSSHSSFDPSAVIPPAPAQALNYSEDNSDLSSGCSLDESAIDDPFQPLRVVESVLDTISTTDLPSPLPHTPTGDLGLSYTEANPDLSSGSVARSPDRIDEDERLRSLSKILEALRKPWPTNAFIQDYSVIPELHPISALICQDQDWVPITGHGVCYHVYTDGSAVSKPTSKAAWAFHIVVESMGPAGPQFHRIGFTGALVDDRTPEAIHDALDAEAAAIIFAADWLLSLTSPVTCVLHFDALAVGYGAAGVQNEPLPAFCHRPLQHLARVALCMVQSYHDSVRCHHINAHSGQPDNEVADSVAHAIVIGWQPPCSPPFRFRELFDHPLRDWAWMEYRPTEELPDLRTILTSKPSAPTLDASIWRTEPVCPRVQVKQITWKFGTAKFRPWLMAMRIFLTRCPFYVHNSRTKPLTFLRCRSVVDVLINVWMMEFSFEYVQRVKAARVVWSYGFASMAPLHRRDVENWCVIILQYGTFPPQSLVWYANILHFLAHLW